MRICIVGAGKIGSALAERLSNEGHDITVIDKNERTVENIANTLDVIGFVGNGATYQVQSDAGAAYADLFIAATATDEVNLLACLVAHKLGARYTVPRVRDPELYSQMHHLKDELGLSMVINPELYVAEEIARVLRFPSANKVELFAKGAAELVECRTPENSVIDGLTIMEAAPKIDTGVLVCAVLRGEEVFIPTGGFVLKGGDYLYITGTHSDLVKTFKKIDMHADRVGSVMITGGGKISYYLASILGHEGMSVKIIEKDPKRADFLASALPGTSVLLGDAMDHELLMEEGIDKSDAFVALTGLDECNILSAAYARSNDVRKVIPKVNATNLTTIMGNLGIDTAVSTKQSTADRMLGYVRALSAGSDSANIELLYSLAGGRIEALEFKAQEGREYLDTPLRELAIRKDVLIAVIVRGRKTIIADGSSEIRAGDRVVVVTSGERITALSDILR